MMLRRQQWFYTLTRWQTFKQRMGTVAKIATCAVVMSLMACGNNEDPNGGGSANGGDDNGAGIKAMLKENFMDDPKHNINSIQVGELVRYDLEVTGTGNSKDFDYKFEPNSDANGRHARLGKDYEAWIFTEANYKVYKDQKTPIAKRNKMMQEAKLKEAGMTIQPNAKYVMLVRPMCPGTFQLDAKCTKTKKGDVKSIYAETPICFNCTKVEGWWFDHEDEKSGIFSHSKSHNNFYFQINDGDEAADKYLTQRENREIKYYVTYNGNNFTGKFVEGRPILFYSDEPRKGGASIVHNQTITSITLHISELGRESINVTYYDIKMNQRYSE
ncbi:MAG: hypothetical protein ACFNM7_01065 [Prevotella conceptionensis]